MIMLHLFIILKDVYFIFIFILVMLSKFLSFLDIIMIIYLGFALFM